MGAYKIIGLLNKEHVFVTNNVLIITQRIYEKPVSFQNHYTDVICNLFFVCLGISVC